MENNAVFSMSASEFVDRIRGILPEYIEDYYTDSEDSPSKELPV